MTHPRGRRFGALVVASIACALVATTEGRASAALTSGQRTTLRAYLDALAAQRYAAAFTLLSPDERRYFGSPQDFASVYEADGFRIVSYRVLGSESTAKGTVAVVSERVEFVDFAHDRRAAVTAKVPYAIVGGAHGPEIRDPGHPWRAVAPQNFTVERAGLRATVREISFFTGRIELIVNFQNRHDGATTVLPFGRTVLRDDTGASYHPLATAVPALTDKVLYIGLRLPSSGEYTGFLIFATPNRYRPKVLRLTIAPALTDGGDSPFSLDFPAFAVPAAS
jgi:hypothetical protein